MSETRLWSIHPRYLDRRGLGALWREALLAQAVLLGRTRGWRGHPQLDRFRGHPEPIEAIGFYLLKVLEEASRRGYSYDGSKIAAPSWGVEPIPVTTGQLSLEFQLLMERLALRDPGWRRRLLSLGEALPEPHPLFTVVEGEPGPWEVSYWRGRGLRSSWPRSPLCV